VIPHARLRTPAERALATARPILLGWRAGGEGMRLNYVRGCGVWVVAALVGCGGGGEGSASATEGATGSTGATTGAGSTGTTGMVEPTTSDGSVSETASGTTDATTGSPTTGSTTEVTSTSSTTTATTGEETTQAGSTSEGEGSSGTTGAVNLPPEITSDPPTELALEVALGGDFEPGLIFLASSVTRKIRVYEAKTLGFVQEWSHPLFDEAVYNPRGMAFNERGNLVVATYSTFIEFSDHAVVFKTYPKKDPEATENVIFDAHGNLYTTTATGGTDRLNQYAAADYAFVQTIKGPPGAGQYTGITFDDMGRLYLASQSDNKIHVAQADEDFKTFNWVKALPGSGPAVRLEGLVFNTTGELVVAQADLLRYDVEMDKVAGSFDVPQDAWPVPVSVDNEGNIYTADFEDGNGSQPADLIRFDPQGQNPLAINDPGLRGPFGLAISGTVLVSDPPVLYSYPVIAVDPEGGPLTFALIKGPPGMMIDEMTGVIKWWVTSKDLGVYEVEVEVTDAMGLTDVQVYSLTISAA
jgi:hypothetical protein